MRLRNPLAYHINRAEATNRRLAQTPDSHFRIVALRPRRTSPKSSPWTGSRTARSSPPATATGWAG